MSADGQFLRLSEGLTYSRREGHPDAIPIVLLHGATVPNWEFDALVPPLLRAGFQTLRFDLYGHGASDRPRGGYTFARFTRQVGELIEASGFPRPAILLGHSFGASLAAHTAVVNPRWISRLVLVAPMLDFASTTRWTNLFRWPGIGELAMHAIALPALIRRRRRRYEGIGMPQLIALFEEQVHHAGYARALLSMFRSDALGDKSRDYAALRSFAAEVMVVTGERDAIIPADHVARVRALLPPHRHLSLPAEHNLLLTHPQQVADALAEWMQAGSK